VRPAASVQAHYLRSSFTRCLRRLSSSGSVAVSVAVTPSRAWSTPLGRTAPPSPVSRTYALAVNWRQFIAAVVQTLAWPLTGLVTVLVFRRKINDLLGQRLTKFRAGPLEAEWAENIREAREAIASEQPPESGSRHDRATETEETAPEDPEIRTEPEVDTGTPASVPEPRPAPPAPAPAPAPAPVEPSVTWEQKNASRGRTQTELRSERDWTSRIKVEERAVTDTLQEVGNLIDISPSSSVVMGFTLLERVLIAFSESMDLAIPGKPTIVGRTVTELARRGVIGKGTVVAIDRLRSLRNAVLHKADVNVTKGEAREYLSTLGDVLRTLLHPALLYESQVADALNRIGANVGRPHEDGAADLLAVTPRGSVAIVIKYTEELFRLAEIQRSVLQSMNYPGILVVTNAPLSNAAREFNRKESFSSSPSLEILTWTGEEDDGILARALARAAR
jgi:hypothetical protein